MTARLHWAFVLLLCSVMAVCRVIAVLTCVIAFCLVVRLFVAGATPRDDQGGVAYISGTGTFSAEHCTFSGNTASVSDAAHALLCVKARLRFCLVAAAMLRHPCMRCVFAALH